MESPIIDDSSKSPNEDAKLEISKITSVFLHNDILDKKTVSYYENNKRSMDSIFDHNDEFQIKGTFHYNTDGLVERLTNFDSNDNIIDNYTIKYDDLKIVEIMWSEDQIDKVTYIDDRIEVKRLDRNDNITYMLVYSINENGLIYRQDNGQIVIEVEYRNKLPVSRRISSSDEIITYNYLNDPLPKNPYKPYTNLFGTYNNQLIFHFDGGLFDIGKLVDLEKYLSSIANYNFTYEFSENDLPTRIEEKNGENTTVKTIEYKDQQ